MGVDLPAGTYVAAPEGSCYWARYDAAGDIVDNNVTDATRVEVTVELDDYSFSSQGCGAWTQLSPADPSSPQDDRTSCGVYRLAYDMSDREEAVTPFLTALREEQQLDPPSAKLIAAFAKQVLQVCSSDAWRDDDAATVGAASRTVYKVYDEYAE